jgi:hypothetical protein
MIQLIIAIIAVFCIQHYTGADRLTSPPPGALTQGEPWPLPWFINYTDATSFDISPDSFEFKSGNSGNCDILLRAFDRYKKLIFNRKRNGTDNFSVLKKSLILIKSHQSGLTIRCFFSV